MLTRDSNLGHFPRTRVGGRYANAAGVQRQWNSSFILWNLGPVASCPYLPDSCYCGNCLNFWYQFNHLGLQVSLIHSFLHSFIHFSSIYPSIQSLIHSFICISSLLLFIYFFDSMSVYRYKIYRSFLTISLVRFRIYISKSVIKATLSWNLCHTASFRLLPRFPSNESLMGGLRGSAMSKR